MKRVMVPVDAVKPLSFEVIEYEVPVGEDTYVMLGLRVGGGAVLLAAGGLEEFSFTSEAYRDMILQRLGLLGGMRSFEVIAVIREGSVFALCWPGGSFVLQMWTDGGEEGEEDELGKVSKVVRAALDPRVEALRRASGWTWD